jgi:hypothetical protein
VWRPLPASALNASHPRSIMPPLAAPPGLYNPPLGQLTAANVPHAGEGQLPPRYTGLSVSRAENGSEPCVNS